MKFSKIDEKVLQILNLKENTNAYVLSKENVILGYGIITNNNSNKIEIFIKEEYRSNGYGKILFKKILEELKKENYEEIRLTFKRDNYRIKSIIKYYGGVQLHTNEIEEVYILPIK